MAGLPLPSEPGESGQPWPALGLGAGRLGPPSLTVCPPVGPPRRCRPGAAEPPGAAAPTPTGRARARRWWERRTGPKTGLGALGLGWAGGRPRHRAPARPGLGRQGLPAGSPKAFSSPAGVCLLEAADGVQPHGSPSGLRRTVAARGTGPGRGAGSRARSLCRALLPLCGELCVEVQSPAFLWPLPGASLLG